MITKTQNKSIGLNDIDTLTPIIPLKDVVIFPNMVVPLFIGRQKSITALEVAAKKDNMVILLSQINPQENEVTIDNIHSIGTLAKILQVLKLPDGTNKVLIEGKTRARALQIIEADGGYLASNVETVTTINDIKNVALEAIKREIVQQFEQYAKLNQKVPEEIVNLITKIESIEQLTDVIITHVVVDLQIRQDLLETISLKKRLNKILKELNREIEILNVEKRIQGAQLFTMPSQCPVCNSLAVREEGEADYRCTG
ncbi:MAG: LON peptidase substrate-binding domain-containing protein, partial [Burkholderiales bacterium]|nr:LON peptidase substrate-binding domain-containing protein [Burkholderiales bacterium]